MPPLNHLLEDKENNSWRQGYCDGAGCEKSLSLLLDNPSKSSTAECEGRRRRCVSFSNQDEFHFVIDRDDYTQDETERCWYSSGDYAEFRVSVFLCSNLHDSDHAPIDDFHHAAWGDGFRSREGMKRRRNLRSRARRAVLNEQQFQESLGEHDAGRIAEVYSDVVREAVDEAINMAMVVHFSANHHYASENNPRDLFSDDWIRSLSVVESKTLATETVFSGGLVPDHALADCSGFDDAWIRDVTATI